MSNSTPPLRQVSKKSRGIVDGYQKWLLFHTGLATSLWSMFIISIALIIVYRASWLLPGGIEIRQIRGEYFHFRVPLNKGFFWTHLVSVMSSGVLAAIQFMPRIRARAIGVHRVIGKGTNILSFVSALSAIGMARVSMGGDLGTQSSVYLLGAMVLWSITKSWMAIRRLQIDEHRAWVIRAWSYQALVLTDRVVIVALIIYITVAGGFYATFSCDEIAYILNDQELYKSDFPQCQANWTGLPVVHVSIEADASDPVLGSNAAARLPFGASLWISIWIHIID